MTEPGAYGAAGEGTGGRLLALACLAFLDEDPETHVAEASAAGFGAVSLRVTGSTSPVRADLALDLRRCARLRRVLDDSGTGVVDVEVLRLEPGLDDDHVASVVEAAHVLGARHLLAVNRALDRDAATDLLDRVVARAAGSGVRPCLEPMRFTRCRSLAEAIATAEPAGAGVLVDALHLARMGDPPRAVADAVRVHGPDLFPYAQLCDAAADTTLDLLDEAVHGRVLPGEGALPLRALLAALPARSPLVVEAPTRALAGSPARVRAEAAMRALRDVLASAPAASGDGGLRG
ncbi:sugar phosphate isomerase/epimerase [Nocardioides cavernae]|uniref:Sugar phosphate isomerase/epimerase n=1 Tax=Nocardioides cavernae TaxID=1921566 RepID=A0A7Y9KQP6_9ACTN|nr:TIM barrel protein [Nocardioides cavernae]NYE35815.1 sugar phosphate isomerase/epimerase [Nocardioides cavernae]